jgi:hypothetical protein
MVGAPYRLWRSVVSPRGTVPLLPPAKHDGTGEVKRRLTQLLRTRSSGKADVHPGPVEVGQSPASGRKRRVRVAEYP